MAGLSRLAGLVLVPLVAGTALAEPDVAPVQDPIAAQLAIGNAPVVPKPASRSKPPRIFSPSAVSEGPKQPAKQPVTVDPALPHAVEVPAVIKATSPDAALANARAPLTPEAINAVRFSRVSPASRTVDPVVLKAEILLDRAHAPPGVIDGRYGSNFVKALRAFQEVRGLEVDGKLTRRVWDELGGDAAAAVFGAYTIRPEDVAGPFYPDLSPDYAEQAKLPDLGYRSAEEMFGERFHMDKKFLRAMNPGVDMGKAGNTIVVALVETLPLSAQIDRIDVDKGKGQVLAYDADGMLVVAYPATIGSDELPSPSGNYVVRGIAPHPTYTYDPKKNFQQGKNTKKLILKPGPNNPVGAAFIALSKPTYGIHGTPDASKIDKTRSHGCVRLTNWNAQELAKMVMVGTPVNFIDKPGAAVLPDPSVANLSDDPIGRLAAPNP